MTIVKYDNKNGVISFYFYLISNTFINYIYYNLINLELILLDVLQIYYLYILLYLYPTKIYY